MNNISCNLTVSRTQDLSARQRQEIVDVCIAAFSEVSFADLFTWVPSGGLHVVAWHAGRIIGHAMATTRWAQPAGCAMLETAYIDAVGVLPECQGQRVGSAVLTHMAASINGYQIACLETDRPSFYQNLGWERWPGPKAGRREGALIPTPDEQNVMILRLPKTPALNLAGLLTIDDQGVRFW